MKVWEKDFWRDGLMRCRLYWAHRRNTLAQVLFFYGAFVLWELVVRMGSGIAFWGVGLLYVGVFCAVAALLLTAICGLFGRRWSKVMAGLFTVVGALLYGSQLVYHTVFGTFYTIYSLFNGTKALGFIDIIVGAMQKQWFGILLLCVPVAVGAFLLCKGAAPCARRRAAATLGLAGLALAAQLYGMGLLFCTGFAPNSAFDLYFCTSALSPSVEKLGMLTAMRLDAQRLAFGFTPVGTDLIQAGAATLGEYEEQMLDEDGNVLPPLGNPDYVKKPSTLPIDWQALMAAAPNDTVQDMHTYFSQQTPTQTNAMTGLFEGKNLIMITAEAFSPLAVDKTRTPTLYKLMHEGLQFTNFYTPLWGVSTLDGEYVACTGLIPKAGVWSMMESSRNAMPFTLGNQLALQGYDTKAYHNHTYDYYRRDLSHPNMGYDYKAYGNGLNVTWQWPESDVEMVDISTDEFMQNTPFHVYYLTVSGHLAYNFMGGNAMSSLHEDAVSGLPLSEPARAYLACQMELDRALALLLERLAQAGQLENTVIALSADHYPYGLTQSEIDELAGHAVDPTFELYRNTFILYNAGVTDGRKITRPSSSLDILPTLSNLFALPYDSRLMMGTDIFSDSDPLVLFADRSWITDKAKYNAATNVLTPLTHEPLPEHYAEDISSIVHQKFLYSAKLLENNYYNIVIK